MPRTGLQRIQDSVHGLMDFRGLETIVIDLLRTREVQRLRRIRQLGLAHLVFPGTEHSRLVHCLGAAFLAIRFARRIQEACHGFLVQQLSPTDASVRDLAVAALCHDLGHGPLSHAWEQEIVGRDFNRAAWIDSLGLKDDSAMLTDIKWHELVTQGLLAWEDGELHKLLESHERGFTKRLRFLLLGQYYLQYLPRLLSSDIDVDRADFIMRDTCQSGVAYGRYDLDWLISSCGIGTANGVLTIGFDGRKGLRVVEQFLIARRALYESVYYHKTVKSAEGLAALFLRRLRDIVHDNKTLEVATFVKPLVRMIQGEALGPHELLSVDDYALSVLVDHVSREPSMDETVRDLGTRILSRDLFKLVPCEPRRIRDFLMSEKSYDQIREAIRPFCAGDPTYYFIVDKTRFATFTELEPNWGYFLDENRTATPIRDHVEFHHRFPDEAESVRLFTISEAVEAVRQIIEHP